MSGFEMTLVALAGGWAAVAVYLNGARLKWKERALRAEEANL